MTPAFRRSALAAAAVAAGLTSACATVPPPAPAVLEFARTDCASAPDLSSALPLTPEKETNGHVVVTQVGPGSPCLTRGAARTPYVLYALPSDLDDKTLTVGGLLEFHRILSPAVSVLDAEGRETRAFRPEEYFYRGPVYSVQFRPRPGDAFLLVTSDPARVGQRYDSIAVGTNTTTVYTGYGAANFTTGVEASTSRVFSYEGTAQVIVYDSDTREEPGTR